MEGGTATDYGPPAHTGSRRISLQNAFRFTQPTLVVTRIGNGRLVVVDSNFRNIATIHIADRPGKHVGTAIESADPSQRIVDILKHRRTGTTLHAPGAGTLHRITAVQEGKVLTNLKIIAGIGSNEVVTDFHFASRSTALVVHHPTKTVRSAGKSAYLSHRVIQISRSNHSATAHLFPGSDIILRSMRLHGVSVGTHIATSPRITVRRLVVGQHNTVLERTPLRSDLVNQLIVALRQIVHPVAVESRSTHTARTPGAYTMFGNVRIQQILIATNSLVFTRHRFRGQSVNHLQRIP